MLSPGTPKRIFVTVWNPFFDPRGWNRIVNFYCFHLSLIFDTFKSRRFISIYIFPSTPSHDVRWKSYFGHISQPGNTRKCLATLTREISDWLLPVKGLGKDHT